MSDEYTPRHSAWAVRMSRFESVYDKEPESDHDIIYWAKATLERHVMNGTISIYRYDELLAQLD